MDISDEEDSNIAKRVNKSNNPSIFPRPPMISTNTKANTDVVIIEDTLDPDVMIIADPKPNKSSKRIIQKTTNINPTMKKKSDPGNVVVDKSLIKRLQAAAAALTKPAQIPTSSSDIRQGHFKTWNVGQNVDQNVEVEKSNFWQKYGKKTKKNSRVKKPPRTSTATKSKNYGKGNFEKLTSLERPWINM